MLSLTLDPRLQAVTPIVVMLSLTLDPFDCFNAYRRISFACDLELNDRCNAYWLILGSAERGYPSIAPRHPDPAAAVHPKQCRPVTIGRLSNCSAEKSRMCLG